MPAAPTVFGADALLDAIATDFAVRGIVGVDLEVGEWETERHSGPPSVIVGLGRATIDEPTDTVYATNGEIDVGNGQEARAFLERVHELPIWVHSIADPNGDPATTAKRARIATATLLDQTTAAIRRTRGGRPILPWSMEPLNEERGEFVYGATWLVTVRIAVPIYDDPSDTMIADGATTTGQMNVGGVLTPATPETSTTP